MKTVATEVPPEDKVQKILNTVSGSNRDVHVMCEGRILRKSDRMKSCGVRDGSTVQVISRTRRGDEHKDKKGKKGEEASHTTGRRDVCDGVRANEAGDGKL